MPSLSETLADILITGKTHFYAPAGKTLIFEKGTKMRQLQK
jgi:hypothetical protein